MWEASTLLATTPHHTTTPITAVYQHMYVHLQIQKCTHKHMRTQAHTHTPVSSLLLMAVPKARIFGLPLTSEMMPQTRRKVSLVHFSFRYKCRNLFCWVWSIFIAIVFWSPLLIMLQCRRSRTTALESISWMNRSRNSSRTCWASYIIIIIIEGEEPCYTNLPTPHVMWLWQCHNVILSQLVLIKAYKLREPLEGSQVKLSSICNSPQTALAYSCENSCTWHNAFQSLQHLSHNQH